MALAATLISPLELKVIMGFNRARAPMLPAALERRPAPDQVFQRVQAGIEMCTVFQRFQPGGDFCGGVSALVPQATCLQYQHFLRDGGGRLTALHNEYRRIVCHFVRHLCALVGAGELAGNGHADDFVSGGLCRLEDAQKALGGGLRGLDVCSGDQHVPEVGHRHGLVVQTGICAAQQRHGDQLHAQGGNLFQTQV